MIGIVPVGLSTVESRPADDMGAYVLLLLSGCLREVMNDVLAKVTERCIGRMSVDPARTELINVLRAGVVFAVPDQQAR